MSSALLHSLRVTPLALAGLLIAPPLLAFDTLGTAWQSGDVAFHLNLDDANSPQKTFPLVDGSNSWKQVFLTTLGDWNDHMRRTNLVEAPASPTPSFGNAKNEVFFSDKVYGEDFGEFTLGVTLWIYSTNNISRTGETDIIFNNTRAWDAYRGTLRVGTDFRRVATHELGHAIGLAHPDEANPAQNVPALMNSSVSDLDLPQNDDVEGARALYFATLTAPVITRPPANVTARMGDVVSFDFEVNGGTPPPFSSFALGYAWYFPDRLPQNFPDNYIFTNDTPRYDVGLAQTYDAGTYSIEVSNPDGVVTADATLTVTPVATTPATQMVNLSTRGFAGSGDRALNVGFVISGTAPKRVLVRAVGPTLGAAPFNLPGTHPNPRLTLFSAETREVRATNEDWSANATEAEQIRTLTTAVGGFALPEGSLDAVILVTLEPGVYSAVVEGGPGQEGLLIVEAYDADLGTGGDSRLINLSTRGYVGTGLEVMVAGLVVEGPGPRTYLLRAVGDTLGDFGINGYLDDTLLTLFRGTDVVRVTDDWDVPFVHQPMLRDAMQTLGAFPLTDRQESALKVTLFPGPYTVQISGFGDAEGVALVEVYEFPE